MKEQSDMPRQTPLVELLLAVPEDARLIYEHSPTESQSIPVGPMCRQAAMELATATRERDEARAEVERLRKTLDEIATYWNGSHRPAETLDAAEWTQGVAEEALAATEAKP